MTKRKIEGIYPLSPLQRGILFHCIYDEQPGVYTVQMSCPLHGELNVDAFKEAWRRVLARHAILRTLFVWEGRDEPLQIVRSDVSMPWEDLDWRPLTCADREEGLKNYLRADRERGFQLSEAPLMRVGLVRLRDNLHHLIWTKHHLLLDGWSSLQVLWETFTLYEAIRHGKEIDLEPARAYQEYLAWLRQQDKEAAESFWRQLLHAFSVPTPLPMETGNAVVGPEASDQERYVYLSETSSRTLEALAREQGLTLNTLVLGVWAILLSRYSGERDVVVGATLSGRPVELTGIESMVGLFINTLPARVQVSDSEPVSSWLRALQAQQVEARNYQYTPLVDVQGWSEVPRGVPLFRTYLVFENYPMKWAMDELRSSGFSLAIGAAEVTERPSYPLVAVAVPGDRMQLRLLYDSKRYSSVSVDQILRHFALLLEALPANSENRLSDLTLLSVAEEHQLLREWSDSECEFPTEALIHELIEGRVECEPDRVAVTFDEQQLTYRELNKRANMLGHYLKNLGLLPESRVGICLDRSLEMVLALLGIVKAGAVYVPLNPAYPPERLAYMMDDSSTAIVLTTSGLNDRLPQGLAIEVCLDADWGSISQESDIDLEAIALPENIAYILYTSGSTGNPKAVAIPHKALLHHMQWMAREFDLNGTDRVFQKTPFSFDASVWEFWAPLLSGGELVLARPGGQSDGEYLTHMIQKSGVTILQVVPSQLRLMLEAGGLAHCNSLRQVFCGGEALAKDLLSEATKHLSCPLCNLYGPTEATIDVLFWRNEAFVGMHAPIGRPIANTRARVLDGGLQLAPPGSCGELYIAGPGLARGYWNNPALTAERFRPEPDGREDRMYYTGDLVRYLHDGRLEFLSRTDHQVKIGGFRIELAEIETVLRQHPGVHDAVVLAREDEPGPRRLVAYVVPEGDLTDGVEELLHFLRQRIPDYMLPSTCVVLASIPLTSNGKIDRRALPKPEEGIRRGGYRPPRNPVEKLLCDVSAQVLGLDKVGIEDNFFRLGGDSILCIQVVSRIRQAGYEIAPIDLFEQQTVAELAATIGARQVPNGQQETGTGEIPLTPIQLRFFEQNLQSPHHWNQAVFLTVLRASRASLDEALRHVVSLHDALRFRFVRDGSGWRQIRVDSIATSYLIQIDLSALAAEEQMFALDLGTAALQESLSLSDGPLLRAALFHLGGQERDRLLIVIHHLVVDGFSWRILLEDLEVINDRLSGGKALDLPAETTSYMRFTELLSDYAARPELKQEAQYWLSDKWDRPSEYMLVDSPIGDNRVGSARELCYWLGPDETRALLREVPAAYHTQINDVLLTALCQALKLTRSEGCTIIDVEGHGREAISPEIDLHRTVGWFTTIFPVRLQLDGSRPPEAIKQIKEQLRAVPRRGIPYGVMRYLSGDQQAMPSLNSRPRPQICFNYLGQFDQKSSESSFFIPDPEQVSFMRAPENSRSHAINVDGMIINGRLRIVWTYDTDINRDIIESLATAFTECLRGLIAHCLTEEAGGYTPSDFPLAGLDQEALDRLVGPRQSVQDVYPLSPIQKGLLFHSLYAPGSGIYLIQMSLEIKGALAVGAFKNSWRAVVDRHPALRTSFIWEGLGQPLQVVHRSADIPWTEEDLRRLSVSEQRDHIDQFLRRDRELDMDLSRAPLLRLALLRTDDDGYCFIWSGHHLLYDAWCRERIIQELLAYYEMYALGTELNLALPRPYRDYIVWLMEQETSAAEAFWREELRGFAVSTPLPMDREIRHDPVQAISDQEAQTWLSSDATGALRAFARDCNLTENTLLVGAWGLLLSRYSGEEDVVLGTTVSGRPAELAGVESMVGLFINTLPARVQASPDSAVVPWLKALQARQWAMRQYETVSLLEIQGWSEVRRGKPLFQTTLVFQNYPVSNSTKEWLAGDKTFRIGKVVVREATSYPLALLAMPGEQMELAAFYDSRWYDRITINKILNQLRSILESMVEGRGKRLCEVDYLSAGEQQQVLLEWCNSELRDSDEVSIPELFERQAARGPDKVAIVARDALLTYGELNRRANKISNHLRRIGVNQAGLVGICVGHSMDEIAGLLGILKTGAGYVPLDSEYPVGRLATILSDARVQVVLTVEQIAVKLPGGTSIPVCLDSDWSLIAQESDSNSSSARLLDGIAYVIYTSGSTGEPKGVAISHRALANYVLWAKTAYASGDSIGATFPLYSSLAFDLTVTSIYTPLISGDKVIVYAVERKESALEEVLQDGRAGLLKVTPSHLSIIRNRDNKNSSIRRLIVGGEALDASLAYDAYQSFGGDLEIYNEYGPTEATVGCVVSKYDPESKNLGQVPIGRPVASASAYVLDHYFNPVAAGVAGELHIGGAGLALGYYGKPEKTAELFIPDGIGCGAGSRMYRTGDYVRWFTDGKLEYIGRRDSQVKVRGVRIELSEVEAILMRHPDVRDTAVVAEGDGYGSQRLVTYLVPSQQPGPTLESLRTYCRQNLPDYMVPTKFVMLDEMPVTTNGKLNRRLLAESEGFPLQLEACYEAPRTKLEQSIAAIWQEALYSERVGIHDNFFDLGGHSLLMVQVHSKLNALFPGLTLVELFEYPTISSLTAFLSEREINTRSSSENDQRQKLLAGKSRLAHRLRQRQPNL
jgi:amino acid adenylation domain-containing protein/non-ribosomal peptide synthase protein (TIGR01720 family)